MYNLFFYPGININNNNNDKENANLWVLKMLKLLLIFFFDRFGISFFTLLIFFYNLIWITVNWIMEKLIA